MNHRFLSCLWRQFQLPYKEAKLPYKEAKLPYKEAELPYKEAELPYKEAGNQRLFWTDLRPFWALWSNLRNPWVLGMP